jgi:hypothetical protein
MTMDSKAAVELAAPDLLFFYYSADAYERGDDDASSFMFSCSRLARWPGSTFSR